MSSYRALQAAKAAFSLNAAANEVPAVDKESGSLGCIAILDTLKFAMLK